jgi:hypothetical protein
MPILPIQLMSDYELNTNLDRGFISDSDVNGYFDSAEIKMPKTIDELIQIISNKQQQNEIHDFHSINRFQKFSFERLEKNLDDALINKWKTWYLCQKLLIGLGREDAQKELDIVLLSKKEFYENACFMHTDKTIGLKAKEFYEKQLKCVDLLLE